MLHCYFFIWLLFCFVFLRYACTALHFPSLRCYLATLLRMHLTLPFLYILLKSSMFSRFSTISFFVLKSFLYALISNYFYFIFFSPDPVLSICPWPPLHSSCSTLIIFNFIIKLGFRIPQSFLPHGMQKHTMKVMASAFPLTRIKFVRQLIYALNLD